ncbi:phytanoyl-CoA dioxygenase family protein [Paenibacillus arenilitoris]|uniref:Phytanoyl-CoA dioxygenase family protein n=1 Tax=Paenibacillus arenilitoris TaxID=2772299 RepID=A0A927H4L8_9BACL|nr:phytanoyl-CoA dioxygenase family protein [Paenibacillus arenilitoris]MBD2868546.1 phytanoyl-CoA dioxygenase family protein [Paenibacillus arenilitoris]
MVDANDDKTLYAYRNEEELELAGSIAKTLYRYDQVEQDRIPTMQHLTEEHVKQFWSRGYLVVEQALSAEEVNRSIEAIMDILSGSSIGSRIQFVRPQSELKTFEEVELAARKIHGFVDHEPRLRAIAHQPAVLEALRKLFGEEPEVAQDQAILKPPAGGAEKPWHQDMAYGALAYDKAVIGMWFALDPAELDNGCMHVIPYSHREGGSPHFAVRDWQLCDRAIQVERDIAIPLKPGGVLIFHGLLHHGTPPNFSAKRRRSIQVHYAPESAQKLSPKEYKRMFTNEMTNAEC